MHTFLCCGWGGTPGKLNDVLFTWNSNTEKFLFLLLCESGIAFAPKLADLTKQRILCTSTNLSMRTVILVSQYD